MFKRTLLAGAMLTAGIGTANAVVLFSDNFDADPLTLSGDPANWDVSNGTIDIIGPGFFNFYPGNGHYLDMDGSTKDAGRIDTSMTFDLVAGQTYTVSFDLGKNGSGSETLTIGLGSQSVDFSFSGIYALLTPMTFSFTPLASLSGAKLFFEAAGGDNQGPVLDNVQLSVSAVPVPPAAALLVSGLAGIAAVGRRRRTSKA